MSSNSKRPRFLKTGFWIIGIGLILCLFSAVGYLAVQSLPAFYQVPPTAKRISWQRLPQPLVVRHDVTSWTTAKKVTDAVSTNDLIWLGTKGGVVVFDQTSGERVKFLPEHGLPSVDITTIAADLNGHIWVGTKDAGIARYDGGAWQSFGPGSGLPSGQIRDIYAAPDGVIWAATAAGVARYAGDEWSTVRFSLFDLVRIDATSVIGHGPIVWIGSRSGIYRFDGERWDFFGLNEGLINERINALTLTPDLNLWAATPSGLSRFNGARWDRFTVRNGLPDLPATDILAAPDNSVWITFGDQSESEISEVVQFDGSTVSELGRFQVNRLVYHSANLYLATNTGLIDMTDPDGQRVTGRSDFPHDDLVELIQTEQGVSIGGSHGLSFLDQGSWGTHERDKLGAVKLADDGRVALAGQYPADGVLLLSSDGSEQELSCETAGVDAGNLYAIAEGVDGAIWILGTEDIGRYHDGQWRYFTDGLPADYTPRKIVADRLGQIWLGLEEGLYQFNLTSERWELFDGRTVQRMTASPAGNLWLVADNQLLHLVDDQFIRFPLPGIDGISRGFVANDAGLWISSQSGVARLSIAGEWELFTAAEGLATNDVTTLAVDGDGLIWAGYADARFGFSYFDDGNWTIVHNIINPDSPNNGHQGFNAPRRDEVVSLSILPNQQVWFGTYFGDIGRIASDELLYEPDDYRLYFANMTALLAGSDGTLWFVGWGGRLARLYPEAVTGAEEIWRIYDSTLATTHVQDVVVQDGLAWLGTDDGVAVIDEDECRMIPHREDLAVVAGAVNPVDNSIWWATSNNGGLRLDQSQEKLSWPILHLRGRRFSDMVQAPDDSLWFVSNAELVRLDGEDRRVQKIEGLGNVSAVTIGVDLRPMVATDQGVFRLRNTEWEKLDWPSNQIIDMAIDSEGAVWILEPHSVYRLNSLNAPNP